MLVLVRQCRLHLITEMTGKASDFLGAETVEEET